MTEALFPRPRKLEPLAGRTPVEAPVAEERDAALGPECYTLHVSDGRVVVRHGDDDGLRHAHRTLAQWRSAARESAMDDVHIEDGPDLPVRGYMLDISRDRVPTRECLALLVERLGALRYNHLQLYTEHTFAYRDHETVWRDASPITPDDVAWLREQCEAQGIELAANQNTFGHMARWLRHDAYRDRAETPDGFDRGGRKAQPTALAPTPDNAAFALDLLRELLPHFESRRVNIGCDEIWELGQGASAQAVAERGKAEVFVEHLRRIAEPLLSDGYEVQFWADMVQKAPEAARPLAEAGAIAAVWGYECPLDIDPASIDYDAMPAEIRDVARDYFEVAGRGFGPRLEAFADAGFRTWVVPGTSGWNSFVGRHGNARGNLLDAVDAGIRHAVEGVLVTEWGDNGHLQPPFATLPALAYGGATAWCRASNGDLPDEALGRAVSALVGDASGQFGKGLVSLGGAVDVLGLPQPNGSAFFYEMIESGFSVQTPPPGKEAFERARDRVDAGLGLLAASSPSARDGALLVRECTQAASLARHGLDELGARHGLLDAPDAARAAAFEALAEEQRACWLARSRPGGLEDSLRHCRRAGRR